MRRGYLGAGGCDHRLAARLAAPRAHREVDNPAGSSSSGPPAASWDTTVCFCLGISMSLISHGVFRPQNAGQVEDRSTRALRPPPPNRPPHPLAQDRARPAPHQRFNHPRAGRVRGYVAVLHLEQEPCPRAPHRRVNHADEVNSGTGSHLPMLTCGTSRRCRPTTDVSESGYFPSGGEWVRRSWGGLRLHREFVALAPLGTSVRHSRNVANGPR
jgi:hypothetical protein